MTAHYFHPHCKTTKKSFTTGRISTAILFSLGTSLLSTLLPATSVAQEDTRTVNSTPTSPTSNKAHHFASEDIFNLEYVSEARVSPDKKQVVYVRRSNDIMSDSTRSNIWLASVDGSKHRPLLSSKHNFYSPRWSPDGKRLAYLSDEEGKHSYMYAGWIPGKRHLLPMSLLPLALLPGRPMESTLHLP